MSIRLFSFFIPRQSLQAMMPGRLMAFAIIIMLLLSWGGALTGLAATLPSAQADSGDKSQAATSPAAIAVPMPAQDYVSESEPDSLEEELDKAAAHISDSPFAPTSEQGQTLYYCYQGKITESRLVVVDKSRQRIMVLKYMGELELEYEFPCATGVQAGNKETEGDERTPEGIYFTTHRFQDTKITIFGDRAIHLDYPNPFDLMHDKKGNGIFIHGTDRSLRARSSNGCVAMRNDDLAVLYGLIKEQYTPIVIVDRLKLPTREERVAVCDALQKISIAKLEAAIPSQGVTLGLSKHPPGYNPIQDYKLQSLQPRFAAFAQPNSPLTSKNSGLLLLGLDDNWVLATDQAISGPRKSKFSVSRRFYLAGADLLNTNLLNNVWVLTDNAQAEKLASHAPQTPAVMTAANAEAPAKVQPQPKEASNAAAATSPAMPASQPKTPPAAPAASPGTPADQIKELLNKWLKAWSSKDLNTYMSFYATDFIGDNMDRQAWRSRKAMLNRSYKKISVRAEDIKVEVKGTTAKVTFVQHYRSDWHRDVGHKELDLVLRNGRWQLVAERWQPL